MVPPNLQEEARKTDLSTFRNFIAQAVKSGMAAKKICKSLQETSKEKEYIICKWKGCGEQFDVINRFEIHLCRGHAVSQELHKCMWADCDRPPFKKAWQLKYHTRCHFNQTKKEYMARTNLKLLENKLKLILKKKKRKISGKRIGQVQQPSPTKFSKSDNLMNDQKSPKFPEFSGKIPDPKMMDNKFVGLAPQPIHPFATCLAPHLSPIPINCCYYGPPPLWQPNPLMNMYPNPYLGFCQPSNPFLFRGNVFGNPFSQLNFYPPSNPYLIKK